MLAAVILVIRLLPFSAQVFHLLFERARVQSTVEMCVLSLLFPPGPPAAQRGSPPGPESESSGERQRQRQRQVLQEKKVGVGSCALLGRLLKGLVSTQLLPSPS